MNDLPYYAANKMLRSFAEFGFQILRPIQRHPLWPSIHGDTSKWIHCVLKEDVRDSAIGLDVEFNSLRGFGFPTKNEHSDLEDMHERFDDLLPFIETLSKQGLDMNSTLHDGIMTILYKRHYQAATF